MNPSLSRRSVLVAGVAGAGAVTLAACGSSSSSSDDDGANSETKAASGGSSGATVLALSAVKVGSSASAKIDGKPVLVFRTGQDSVVCHTAICTHQGCTVKPDGAKLACPCHGSVYDAKTGKVLQGPAPSPLAAIQVQVENGKIVTT